MPATQVARESIEKVIAEVRRGRDGSYDISQVMSFAELMIEAVQTFLNTYDNAVYNEIREIGEYIAKAKGEISSLQANDLQENHIPEAGRELDEIIKSTESATHTIMEAAEKLMEIEADTLESYQEQTNDHVMAIFEACSFQDITGQRINKVVHTLKYIDNRIARFSDAFGIGSDEIVLNEEEAEYEQRKKDLILHGPAFEGEGTNQDGVDALLDVADLVIEEPEETAAPTQSAPEMSVSEPEGSTQEAKQEAAAPKQEAAAAPKKEAAAPKKEAAAAPKKEPTAPKKEAAAAPKKEAAAPKQEAAAPKKEPTAPKQEAATAPKKEAAAPKKDAAAAPKKEPAAPKKESAAAPKKEPAAPKPAPAEASDDGGDNSQADIDALFD